MDLSSLKPKVRNKKPKRLGRSVGSGHGKTSGRGHKGAGQRAGKKRPYEGFAGGNIPYLRKIPKRGFNPPKRLEYQIVNLEDVQKKSKDIEVIDPIVLKKVNLIKNENKPVKILANLREDFNLKATFKADKFSKKAKEIIESAGGKVECLKR
ncbi:MAG TPA: 50S ribosomal protein L15 [Candidatus Omnitrophica bacterium]|nr:50S ribosomal protein L15 [Candidatus Omnitrophota bacterium]